MNYTHRTHQRAKHIKLKVESPQQVVVTSPPNTKPTKIKQFVAKHQAWIKKQQNKLQKIKDSIETEQEIKIFGRRYQKQFNFEPQRKAGLYLTGNYLQFNFPFCQQRAIRHTMQSTLQTELKQFLKNKATQYFKQRLPILAAQLEVKYNQVKVKNQKTRWGSCSSLGNLNLNWRLVHHPQAVIDYLLIHELAHLKYDNHSDSFWRLVAKHDPDYQQHRSYLKHQATTLI